MMGLKRRLAAGSAILLAFVLAFGGGGGGGGGSPTNCTVKIIQADEVYSPASQQLYFTAQVGGSGCYATSVQWSSQLNTGGWYTTLSTEYDSELGPEYSKATVYGGSLGLSTFQSDTYYATVTAKIGNTSDYVTVIGDSERPGKTARTALTIFQNSSGKMETKPYWYWAKKVNDGTCCSDIAQYYRGWVNQYSQPWPSDWYSKGFMVLGDDLVFDPYGAINRHFNSNVVTPPGSAPRIMSLNIGSAQLGSVHLQAATSCPGGDCVGIGGIFLGYTPGRWQEAYWQNGLRSISEFGYNPMQHAALKTNTSTYIEAPFKGRPVRERPTSAVVAPFTERHVYIQPNGSGAYTAADWARRQIGKPYSITVAMQGNRKGDFNTTYPAFYCSLLVWGAWYHGAGVDIAPSVPYWTNAPINFDFIVAPGDLYVGARRGSGTVVADFRP